MLLLFLNTGSPHHRRLAGLQLSRPTCTWSVKPFASAEGEHIGVMALKEDCRVHTLNLFLFSPVSLTRNEKSHCRQHQGCRVLPLLQYNVWGISKWMALLTSPTFYCTAITLVCIFKNFSPCDITNAAARWCRGFQLSVGDMFFSHGPKKKKKKINIMTL